MRKILTIGIIVIFVVGVVVILTNQNGDKQVAGDYGMTTATTTANDLNSYLMIEVASHNSVASCWTTINGGVYDLTAWIDRHPGGKEAILGLCGKDGSAAFDGQHGGQKRPAKELAGFQIGSLKK